MQNRRKLRIRHRSKFNQLILLDFNGELHYSCDSIFSTRNLERNYLFRHSPLLESIFPSLIKLKKNSEVKFTKMESSLSFLPGIYDYSFRSTILEGEPFIIWSIYDYSDLYEEYRLYQQRKNELEIYRESLERRHDQIQEKASLQIQQNIILEHLDHFQLDYFNRIKSALLGPVNPLDGLSFGMHSYTQAPMLDYLDALQQTVSLLGDIIAEFPVLPDVNSASKNKYSLIRMCADLQHFVHQQHAESKPLDFDLAQTDQRADHAQNFEPLLQILYGLAVNCYTLFPQADLRLSLQSLPVTSLQLSNRWRVTLTEQLVNRTDLPPVAILQKTYYRLCVVRQLMERNGKLHRITKNAKDLSITISFDFH